MRPKSNIYAVKKGSNGWDIRAGNKETLHRGGVSRVLRKMSTLIDDKDAVVVLTVQVKRKR